MSKSRASATLRSGRSGKSAKSRAALALAGNKSRADRRAAGKTRMYDRNSEKPWSAADTKMFRQLVRQNTPTRVIGLKLGRTEDSVYDKAKSLGVSLKPTNQPPNLGRKSKSSRR
jgi:hypothetical protein